MSIIDFANDSANRRTTTAASDRPKAKMWLNFGYEKNGKFVNLPVGIPVDTMEPLKISGQNEEWGQFQHARNELLKKIQAAGDALEPGAEMVINLQVRLRHTAEEMKIDPETNQFSDDLSSLLGEVLPKQNAAG